jgi:AmiR/NasT family two-component response regulator
MPEPRPLHVLLCDQDPVARRTLGDVATAAGFTVVAETNNVIEALNLAAPLEATLVMLTTESLMGNPVEILAEFPEGPAGTEVVLITADPAVKARAAQAGVFTVAGHGDVATLERSTVALADALATGERRRAVDRRVADRRIDQVWSKVISERRKTGRRQADRRGTVA